MLLVYMYLWLHCRQWLNVNELIIIEEFERPCYIRGYHVYQEVWIAAVSDTGLRFLSVAAFGSDFTIG